MIGYLRRASNNDGNYCKYCIAFAISECFVHCRRKERESKSSEGAKAIDRCQRYQRDWSMSGYHTI